VHKINTTWQFAPLTDTVNALRFEHFYHTSMLMQAEHDMVMADLTYYPSVCSSFTCWYCI